MSTLSHAEAESLCARVDQGMIDLRTSYAECMRLGIPWSSVLAGSASADDVTPRQQRVSHLYAMQVGADGPIKIGRAIDPSKRRNEIQTSNPAPVRLLAAVPETKHLNERTEHARLANLRIRGEWFDVTPADLPWVTS